MSRTSSAACEKVEKWIIYVLEVHVGSYNAAPLCMHDTIGYTQLSCDDVLKFDQNCQISGSRSISLISPKLPGWFLYGPERGYFVIWWHSCCASAFALCGLEGFGKWFLCLFIVILWSVKFPVAIFSGLRKQPQSCCAVYYGVQCLLWSALQSFRSSHFKQGVFLHV